MAKPYLVPVNLTAGAVGAPALYLSGDSTTGLWRPGADALAVSIAGSEKIRLTSTGLGIGATPSQALDVNGVIRFGNVTSGITGLLRTAGGSSELIQLGAQTGSTTELSVGVGAVSTSLGSQVSLFSSGIIKFLGVSAADYGRFTGTGELLIGHTAAVSNTARLQVGNTSSQNTIKIVGTSTADMAPVLSLYRSGSREMFMAAYTTGGLLLLGNTSGLANYNDATLLAGADIAVATNGDVTVGYRLTTGDANLYVGSSNLTTGSAALQLGQGRTNSGYAYIDLLGDTTYTDYALRLIRNNSGANASSQLLHRGTGALTIHANEAANVSIWTQASERLRVTSGGDTHLTGKLALGSLSAFGFGAAGDIIAQRNDTTGVIYLGNTGLRYLYYNGTTYDMPGANLTVNGGTVWHANNDGAGSGLDADTVDGYQGASLAVLSEDEVITGQWNFPGKSFWYVTRTLPTTVDDCVDIGTFTTTNGAGTLRITITVPSSGFSLSSVYNLAIGYNETANQWNIVAPISTTGVFSSQNFTLEARVNNTLCDLRVRRAAGTTAGTLHVSIIEEGDVSTSTFTPSTTVTSAAAAVTAYYPSAGLIQSDNLLKFVGNTTIGGTTDNGYKLDITGTLRATGVTTLGDNVLIGTTTNLGSSIYIVEPTTLSVGTTSSYAIVVNQAAADRFAIGADTNGAHLQSFSSKPLILNASGNNVLINTTSDALSVKLRVAGEIVASGASNSVGVTRRDTDARAWSFYSSASELSFYDYTASTDQFKVLATSGRFLIGATDDTVNKLQVNGSIIGTVLKSSVSTGTAPLTVASTTKVTNLNADLLDDMNTASANTASTVVVRDGSARFQAADPSAAQDVATKNYVDTRAPIIVAGGNLSTSGDNTLTCPSGTWRQMSLVIQDLKAASDYVPYFRINADTSNNYTYNIGVETSAGTFVGTAAAAVSGMNSIYTTHKIEDSTADTHHFTQIVFTFFNPHNADKFGKIEVPLYREAGTSAHHTVLSHGWRFFGASSAFTSLSLLLRDTTGNAPSGSTVNPSGGVYYWVGIPG